MDFKYNLRNSIIIFIFSLILAIPPFLWGGKEPTAKFLFFSLLFPLICLFWKRKSKFRTNSLLPSFVLLAIFVLGIGLSIIYSPEKYHGLETFFLFLGYFILLFLTFDFVTPEKQLNYFSFLVLGIGTVLSLMGIYEFILSQSFGYPRIGSTFDYHIPFGEFLIYPLFLGLSLLCLSSLKRLWKILLIIANSFLLITFLFVFSRGAWLSFLLISFVLVLFFWKTIFKKRVLISLVCIIIISTIGIYSLYQLKVQQAETVSQKVLYSQETMKENALTVRFYFWQSALEIFKDKPILGGGLESFRSLHRQYLKPPFFYTADPHNFYLKILAETGIILFLVFLGFIISLVYCSFFLLKKTKARLQGKVETTDLFLIGIIAGVASAIIHNSINFGWYFPANSIMFFMFSGIILKAYWLEKKTRDKKEESLRANGKNKTYALLSIFSLILFFVGTITLISDFYAKHGQVSLDDGKIKESLFYLEKALKTNPINPDYNTSASLAYFLLAQKDSESQQEFLLKSKNFNEMSLKWTANPSDLNFQGKIYIFEKKYDLAEKSFKQAITKQPVGFDGYIELANLYTQQNRFSEIYLLLDNILPKYHKEYILSPYYMVPDKKVPLYKISLLHNINGAAYLKEEEFEKAEKEFKKAVYYFSENELAYANLIDLKIKTNEKELAKHYLQEGLKNNPNSIILRVMESLLER